MKEEVGNIWDRWEEGSWIAITTNGDTNRFGLAVMGRGLAKQAMRKIPGMAYGLAEKLKADGNHVFNFDDIHLVTFPVKVHWHDDADLDLIKQSCKELLDLVNKGVVKTPFYLTRVGCGNGLLSWAEVKPILTKYFDDRFIVCEINPEGIPYIGGMFLA